MQKKCVTAKELAEMLRVEPATIYDWAALTTIPHLRIGRTLRFDLEEVLEWMKCEGNQGKQP
jgi:excisionase family DNA binding protein